MFSPLLFRHKTKLYKKYNYQNDISISKDAPTCVVLSVFCLVWCHSSVPQLHWSHRSDLEKLLWPFGAGISENPNGLLVKIDGLLKIQKSYIQCIITKELLSELIIQLRIGLFELWNCIFDETQLFKRIKAHSGFTFFLWKFDKQHYFGTDKEIRRLDLVWHWREEKTW